VIEDLLEHIGVEDLQPRDNEIGARCPMHEQRTGELERTPRHFFVNRSTGAFHCFSCEYGGSLVKLIMDVTKLGLWDAHQLVRRFDVDLDSPNEERTWEPPVPSRDLATKLAEFGPPPARAMARRHLDPESVDRFGVRWDYELSAWIFPIYGPTGDLWGWQSKSAEWVRNRPPGIRKSLTLFGIQLPRNDPYVILVESPLDIVYLEGLGYPAVASFGAGVSDAQMRLIIEHFDELILALDNDEAGRNETRRLLTEKWHHRIPIQIFDYGSSRGKDPGELAPHQVKAAMDDLTLAAFW
jgi:DNA primase